MAEIFPSQLKKSFLYSAAALLAVLGIGTLGYWMISGKTSSFLDSFYMTFITIATIGFGEIVDLSHSPFGRLFTVFISMAGIGVMTYMLMSTTAFVVEGRMNEAFRKRRMEKMINTFEGHYIVCGIEGTGYYIANELFNTKRSFVVVDPERPKIDRAALAFPDLIFIEGDPTDNAVLIKAGIVHAQGLFAVTSDDNLNLVIGLTAKQINPAVRVVMSCHEVKNTEKMKKAGADAVVSPTYIGGLRMASEMIRPTVVSFLDVMMSRKEENLRVEEVAVPKTYFGRSLAALNLKRFEHLLLLAVRTEHGWQYNPPREYAMKEGDKLIFMSTPAERREIEDLFSGP